MPPPPTPPPLTPPPLWLLLFQVYEIEAETMPLGPNNPHGVGFDVSERLLQTEQEAQRNVAPERSRVWKVRRHAAARTCPPARLPSLPACLPACGARSHAHARAPPPLPHPHPLATQIANPGSINPLTGKPVAWKLMPMATPPMLAHPTSSHQTRGAFATKHLWVTPYTENEMNPAGGERALEGAGAGAAANSCAVAAPCARRPPQPIRCAHLPPPPALPLQTTPSTPTQSRTRGWWSGRAPTAAWPTRTWWCGTRLG